MILFAGIAVVDLPVARAWYERLFGRAADLIPNEREAAWQVADGGWVYLVTDPERAGKALVTVIVEDLEAQVAELAERGVEPESLETIPGAAAKAEFTDPEGNAITFGQPLNV
jgi:predicted enzyme related to lactoylglutathione lyase